MDPRDLVCRLAVGAAPRRRSPPRSTPNRARSMSASASPCTSSSADVVGDLVDLGLRAGAPSRSWFSGRVVDVAGAVDLLDPTDAVHQAGRAGNGPRPGEVSRRGGTARTRVAVVVDVVELGGERHRDVGQRRRCRAAATARSRWPGSRRCSRITGVRYFRRCVRPRSQRRSTGPGCSCATIGSGDSP